MPPVIEVRKQFYQEDERYKMIGQSVTDFGWMDMIEVGERPVLVVAEGLTMYLTDEENKQLMVNFKEKFGQVDYVFDAYSLSAVKWSKRKNPVNAMGATIRWGLDDPQELCQATSGIQHRVTRYFTDKKWSDKLSGNTRRWFRILYGNKWANSLYRIYYFQIRK